jgi:methionyl-tRNA formyltransferase
MDLALLGSGPELLAAHASLQAAGHRIRWMDARRVEAFPELRDRPVPISSHQEAVALGASHILLVSYGTLIDAVDLERATFLNVHFALLPKYRGYHGLVWSILNGETEVGFTLHQVDEGIDTGPIYYQARLFLASGEDINDARTRILEALRAQLGEAVTRIAEGQRPVPQDRSASTIGARRCPDDGWIDWRWPAMRIANLVRAVAPPLYPGALTRWRGRPLTIRRVTQLPNPPFLGPTGRVVDFLGEAAWVMCGDRMLQVDAVEYDGEVLPPRRVIPRVGSRLG